MGTELQPNPLPDLSLFHLDAELQALVMYREERAGDTEDPITPEELAAVDAEITKYLEALPKKVSGVVAVFRDWQSKRETAKKERDRYAKIVQHFDGLEKRLKEYCAAILERQPEPKKGARKLVGADGSMLILKGNGGLQPLEITDAAAIPEELNTVTCEMPADLFRRLSANWEGLKVVSVGPNNAAIRAVIQAEGGVPGARLLERGQHVEVK